MCGSAQSLGKPGTGTATQVRDISITTTMTEYSEEHVVEYCEREGPCPSIFIAYHVAAKLWVLFKVMSWVLTFWAIPDWYWRESLLRGVLTNNTDDDDDDSTALHPLPLPLPLPLPWPARDTVLRPRQRRRKAPSKDASHNR